MTPLTRKRVAIDVSIALVLLALAVLSLHATRERHFDANLESDEPQWIGVSILHWRQLTRGGPPAGADAEVLRASGASPWKEGFQRASFGARNPCLPKLVWGAALDLGGHREASPLVFPRLRDGDEVAGRAAERALLPALPAARAVLLAFSASCAVSLFFVARALAGGGLAGTPIGLFAWALWLASPLIQRWANYLRTDFFMLALALFALGLAIALRESLAGARGRRARLVSAAAVGVACGLTISCKLNGAILLIAALAWVPLLGWSALGSATGGGRGGPLPALGALLAACGLTFWALNPVLGLHPLAELREMVGFWSEHMVYQQDRGEGAGFAATRTLGERLALVSERWFARDEPLRAITGLPGGALLMAAGAVALLLSIARGERPERETALLVGVWLGCFVVGSTLWLPLDWDRYFFPLVACAILLDASLLAAVVRRLARRAQAAEGA